MKFRPLFITAVFVSFPLTAWAVPNPQAGEEIALQSCTSCHAPMTTQKPANAAPSFSEIAKQGKNKRGWTQAWMSNPHKMRAGINLTTQQAADVTAYLKLIPTG